MLLLPEGALVVLWLPYVDRLLPYRELLPDPPVVVGREPRREVGLADGRVPLEVDDELR
ncbi:MAG: hypothetical protein OXN89_20025 [Bryobacterales bacterium]|nr:hypothetical protein [Bryobacterales bacterium]